MPSLRVPCAPQLEFDDASYVQLLVSQAPVTPSTRAFSDSAVARSLDEGVRNWKEEYPGVVGLLGFLVVGRFLLGLGVVVVVIVWGSWVGEVGLGRFGQWWW